MTAGFLRDSDTKALVVVGLVGGALYLPLEQNQLLGQDEPLYRNGVLA